MKPLHICNECKGKGYEIQPSTDIRGEFTYDVIECVYCDGTGLTEGDESNVNSIRVQAVTEAATRQE